MNCSCLKKPYETRAQARAGYHRMLSYGAEKRALNGRLHTYRCAEGSWHLGHAHLQYVVMQRRGRAA